MADGIERFLEPQAQTHAQALRELTEGRKVSHWIWWEMPQLATLGRSHRATEYGLSGLDEAGEYLAHPVLRARLVELCEAMLQHRDSDAGAILGPVDALKARSMATLFASVPNAPSVFDEILDTFYGGEPCPLTRAETG